MTELSARALYVPERQTLSAPLVLYSRSDCGLCNVMIGQLSELRARGILSFVVVDLQERPDLEARYGEWVPVLMAGEDELCHYYLDPGALGAWLAGGGTDAAR